MSAAMRTFVLRIWEPASGDPTPSALPLRGVLEEVATGEQVMFTGHDHLVAAIERAVQREDRGVREPA